jgi:hypothetical protein
MEMSMESMEIITMAVDKHAATKNYEVSLIFLFFSHLPSTSCNVGCRSID